MVTGSNLKNVDNLNNKRSESSRHFRNSKKEYMKAKIYELETKNVIKNTRDLYRDNKGITSLELI